MRANYHVGSKRPASKKAVTQRISTKQVKNEAGGFVWPVDGWTRLNRFLILGTEGGTFYVGQRKLDIKNASNIMTCLWKDHERTIQEAVRVSKAGLAPKNDPALFVLAVAATAQPARGTGFGPVSAENCRKYARNVLQDMCRIPTHLFTFLDYYKQLGGTFGRSMQRAIERWYNRYEPDQLAYHMLKYQQREGWSNRDVLRLGHVKAKSHKHNAVLRWVVAGSDAMGKRSVASYGRNKPARHYKSILKRDTPDLLFAYEEAKGLNLGTKTGRRRLVNLIGRYNLSHEMIPTEGKKYPEIWEALMQKMPTGALIRNLGNLSKVGLLDQGSEAAEKVGLQITNEEILRKARIHPLNLYVAQKTYASGQGVRGKGVWEVNPDITDALESAFYASFGFVPQNNKRMLLSVDVSGSMTWSKIINDMCSLWEVAAVMMMVSLHSCRTAHTTVFDNYCRALPIRKRDTIEAVVKKINDGYHGGTNIGSVVEYALGKTGGNYDPWSRRSRGGKQTQEPKDLDGIVIYTDNETWHGSHPSAALKAYKTSVNKDVKVVVVSMTATEYTSFRDQPGVLQVAGFDLSIPAVINAWME